MYERLWFDFPKNRVKKKLETSNITAYVTTLSIQCTSLKPVSTASSRPWKIAVNYFKTDFVKIGDEDTLSWKLWNFEFNFDCKTQKKVISLLSAVQINKILNINFTFFTIRFRLAAPRFRRKVQRGGCKCTCLTPLDTGRVVLQIDTFCIGVAFTRSRR